MRCEWESQNEAANPLADPGESIRRLRSGVVGRVSVPVATLCFAKITDIAAESWPEDEGPRFKISQIGADRCKQPLEVRAAPWRIGMENHFR